MSKVSIDFFSFPNKNGKSYNKNVQSLNRMHDFFNETTNFQKSKFITDFSKTKKIFSTAAITSFILYSFDKSIEISIDMDFLNIKIMFICMSIIYFRCLNSYSFT